MSTEQATFDVPEGDPWKNEDTLRGLYHGDDLNQSEIAEYFSENGHEVTPPTISYWMGKHKISTSHSDYDDGRNEDGVECAYHEVCGNETCGTRNLVCRDCLEVVRQRQTDGYSSPVEMEGDDFTTMNEHIEELYEKYD